MKLFILTEPQTAFVMHTNAKEVGYTIDIPAGTILLWAGLESLEQKLSNKFRFALTPVGTPVFLSSENLVDF